MQYEINDRRYDVAKAVCDGNVTGVFVRAQHGDGTWNSVDIACLKNDSLRSWLNKYEREELIELVHWLLTEDQDD